MARNDEIESKLIGEDLFVGAMHLVVAMDQTGKQYLTVAMSGQLSKFQALGVLEAAKHRLLEMARRVASYQHHILRHPPQTARHGERDNQRQPQPGRGAHR